MDLDDLYRLLRSSHVQAQGVMDTIRNPLLILTSDMTVISANPAFYQTFETSRDDTVGVALHDLGDGQWNIKELRLLLEDVLPKSASVLDYEVRGVFPHIGERTMLVTAQRLKHPDNGQRIMLVSIVDATQRRQDEDEKDILIGELDHRIKNLLAVTQSLARQTSVEGRTAEEYRDAFLARFEAMARSLSMTGKTADLAELVQTAMEPIAQSTHCVTITEGPAVSLRPSEVTALSLVLHELTTNAVKHGALSVPEGQVAIGWRLAPHEDGHRRVHLDWVESNGPETAPPTETGFGTRLITFAAERELRGTLEQDYRPDGLSLRMSFPQRE